MKNYIAIGDVILDIYYDSKLNLLGYYSGGSIWNDLINIKGHSIEHNCYGIGVCGSDWGGELVMEILAQHGINLSNIRKIPKQTNRFNIIVDKEKTKSQKQCPICKKSIWHSTTKISTSIPEQLLDISPGVIIIDSLRKNVLELSQQFRKNGWYVAADIGFINHLRYLSIETIQALFIGKIDFLQINNRVYSFLANKLSLNGQEHLFELFKCRYMSITNGAEGAKFLFRGETGTIFCTNVPAKSAQVIDPTGAGDMFFSSLLLCLNENGYLNGSIEEILCLASSKAAERISVVGAVGKLIHNNAPNDGCPICGRIAIEPKPQGCKKQRIETNTNYLLDRILRSLESDASKQIREVLDNIEGLVYMIGTGGSYVSACYVAEVVNCFSKTASAIVFHPRDIAIHGLGKANAIFLFSYSGSTKDILNIYQLGRECSIPTYMITKKRVSDGDDFNFTNTLISYSNSNSNARERGFLSMAGTLIPMCVFAEIFYDDSEDLFSDFLKECFTKRNKEFAKGIEIAQSISIGFTVDIFYDAGTNCAALDLESKCIESGIGRATMHEKKDFSHGRFNILERMPSDFIVFFEGQAGHYSEKLKAYLEVRNIPIVYLKTRYQGIWGQLDLIIATQYFLKTISKKLDYDMSKPDYPKDAMTLYRYSGKDLL